MRAITGSDDISLDALAHVSSAAFEVTLERLGDYIRLSNAGERLIRTPDMLLRALNEVGETQADNITELVRRSDPNCVVPNLAEVPRTAWRALCDLKRFPATLGNVANYVDHAGRVDDSLAELLTEAKSISTNKEDSQERRLEIAKAILAAPPLLRARFSGSDSPRALGSTALWSHKILNPSRATWLRALSRRTFWTTTQAFRDALDGRLAHARGRARGLVDSGRLPRARVSASGRGRALAEERESAPASARTRRG